jgi:hypothetical protein
LEKNAMTRLMWMLTTFLVPGIALAGSINEPRISVFEKALNVIFATAAPQITMKTRKKIIKDYEDAKANKGQAIELLSGNTWRSTDHEDQAVTGDRTLEGCQLRYGKPCALIAVNEEIVAEGELISKDMPRLHYAGKFDLAQIPVIRFVTRNSFGAQHYFGTAESKAMAIVATGRIYISQGAASLIEAEREVLNKCNTDPARDASEGACFLYASNNNVVLSKRLISANPMQEPLGSGNSTLAEGKRLNVFAADDARRIAKMGDELQFTMPPFEIGETKSDVPNAYRRFVGIWSSKTGFGGQGRHAMLIVTEVHSDGLALGFSVWGPSTRSSWERIPAGSESFAERILDGTLSVKVNKSIWAATLTDHNSMMLRSAHTGLDKRTETASIDLSPIWQLFPQDSATTSKR